MSSVVSQPDQKIWRTAWGRGAVAYGNVLKLEQPQVWCERMSHFAVPATVHASRLLHRCSLSCEAGRPHGVVNGCYLAPETVHEQRRGQMLSVGWNRRMDVLRVVLAAVRVGPRRNRHRVAGWRCTCLDVVTVTAPGNVLSFLQTRHRQSGRKAMAAAHTLQVEVTRE